MNSHIIFHITNVLGKFYRISHFKLVKCFSILEFQFNINGCRILTRCHIKTDYLYHTSDAAFISTFFLFVKMDLNIIFSH